MSSSSSTFIIGIGPSGSSQATIQLTTPTPSTFSTTSPDITPSSDMSTISSVGHPSATPSSTPSAASRTPNLGAIIGGTLGGITALLWLLLLLWWANRHSWFHRPGYKRHSDPDTERTYEKPKPIVPTSEFARPPQPPAGTIGARTFGQPQPVHLPSRMSFGDPPRQSYGDPPRTNFEKTSFGDLPRPNFGSAPPVPTRPNPPPTARSLSGFGGSTFGDRPMSSFGDRSGFGDRDRERDRPRSGFGELDRPRSIFGELDRPRSGFGDRDRPRSGFGDSRRSLSPDRVRRFFTGQNKQDEWAGAGRRISMEPASLEMEDRGVLGFFARVKESAARRKRVKAEYEEDMRRMRGRSVGDSDFGRF